MPVDLSSLIGLVKESKILTKEDRKYWLKKMETMSEKDLRELEEILTQGEQLDLEKETANYVSAVAKAEELVSATAMRLGLPQ